MAILGLHHVTATVDDAQADLDFCLGGLGMRLVKKTVNFDNHTSITSTTATSTARRAPSGRRSPTKGAVCPRGTKARARSR